MDTQTKDAGLADSSDVGCDVWALMPAESISICMACGAPCRLCQHTDDWQLFDIPCVVTGKLLSYVASVERATPDCRIEGAGMDSPIAVFRSESDAQHWQRKEHGLEMGLLMLWATGQNPFLG